MGIDDVHETEKREGWNAVSCPYDVAAILGRGMRAFLYEDRG